MNTTTYVPVYAGEERIGARTVSTLIIRGSGVADTRVSDQAGNDLGGSTCAPTEEAARAQHARWVKYARGQR